jgi:predicted dithiol-disulfide oxidoreductase (DUF899 family)
MKTKAKMQLPKVVSTKEWEAAQKKFLVKEKAATRASDKLAAERRRLPRLRMEKDYVFKGPGGKATLLDLFEGRRQLLLYHFMYAPDVGGWPKAACPGCSMVVDNLGNLIHLNARETSFALVSRAPLARIQAYKKRMGWTLPWYSSAGTEFNRDMGVTTDEGENFCLSAFIREGDEIFRTYYTGGRGIETRGTIWTLLDLTALGRQETWEDSPPGYPQTPPFQWWRRHDEY